ncbi:MAG: DUF4340 domain-containing protein [Clostridia bacterium]|nr:DUF4340 domain-containing protein [Clostridia bacterium]
MKNLSRFQKQLIGIAAVALVAVILFVLYSVFSGGKEEQGKAPVLNYGFSQAEETALKAFTGSAEFRFAAQRGKASAEVAPLMALAEDYTKLNGGITVSYGEGSDDCALTVNGETTVIDVGAEELYRKLKDGTLYAFSARELYNTALFGESLGVAKYEPLPGYDLDGDVINAGGNIVMYSLGDKNEELSYVLINNEHGELKFFVIDGNIYLGGAEDMGLSTANTVMLVSYARQPFATGKVANPKALSEYGLDSQENATATLIAENEDGEVHVLLIGKQTPDGSGYYVRCDDRDRVYISSPYASYALRTPESFVTGSYGEALDKMEEVFTKVDDMAVTFEDGETLTLETLTAAELAEELKTRPNYTWKITGPDRFVTGDKGYTLSNFGNVGDIFYALSILSSEEVVSISTEAEVLAEHGLDKPHRIFEWVYNGSVRCKVFCSKPQNGKMHVYGVKEYLEKDGTVKSTANIGVGVVSTSDFPYMDYRIIDYVDNKLFTHYIDSVDTITFLKGEESHTVAFGKNKEGKIESATLDGKSVDLQSARRVYVEILGCTILEEYEGAVPEAPTFTVTVKQGKSETVLTFTRVSTVKVHCTVNGKGKYCIAYDDLEELMKDFNTLLKGEIVPR